MYPALAPTLRMVHAIAPKELRLRAEQLWTPALCMSWFMPASSLCSTELQLVHGAIPTECLSKVIS